MLIELFLNLLVAALLTATIGWCWQLNKRIQILQDGRGELAELLRHFDESTRRASESIVALQAASRKIGETMQARVEKANYVADDLAFLIERAQKLNRSEKPQAREEDADSFPPPRREPPPATRMQDEAESGRGMGALQAMLEKLTARARDEIKAGRPAKREPEVAAAEEKARARSRVEQELLEILRAGDKV